MWCVKIRFIEVVLQGFYLLRALLNRPDPDNRRFFFYTKELHSPCNNDTTPKILCLDSPSFLIEIKISNFFFNFCQNFKLKKKRIISGGSLRKAKKVKKAKKSTDFFLLLIPSIVFCDFIAFI